MAADIKAYHFLKGADDSLDREFSEAPRYGKVKPGQSVLFWKAGLKWYCIPYTKINRIYRQRQGVYGRLCCGGRNYFIERLVLVCTDGSALPLHIGDDAKKEAETLFQLLQTSHPELEFGKEG